MAEGPDARRREFTARAPELRAALVAELTKSLDAAAALAPDEAAVVRHVLAYAGFSLDGHIFLPSLKVLWGDEASYVPAVRLHPDRVRAAVRILTRRGVLSGTQSHGGVILVPAALNALAGPASTAEAPVLPPAAAAAAAPKARRVHVYIAASVDGYIAKKNGDISFLDQVAAPPEDYGYAEFLAGVDTVIMGRKTYDKVLTFPEFPHAGRKVYVLSRKRKGAKAGVTYSGNVVKLVEKLRRSGGKDIFCDGGSGAVHELLKHDLVDSLVISLIPVLLGGGIPLFKSGRAERRLRLVSSRAFPTGLVQLRYERA